MKKIILVSLLTLPFVSYAQGLQDFMKNLLTFLSNVVIPFLLGIAFLFFVYNAFRFFIAGGASEDGRKKARALAIYGIAAFVIIIIFWGIVNLFASSLGYQGKEQPGSDYVDLMATKGG